MQGSSAKKSPAPRIAYSRVLNPAQPDLRTLRANLGLSQSQFADRYGLSIRTVQQWEQERAAPDQPARILLALIANEPDTMQRLIESLFRKQRAKPKPKVIRS